MTSSVRRSPVSVFESSSYSSVENSNFELPLIPAKRPRSKHRRLSSFNKLFLIQFIPPFQKHQSKTQCAGKPRKRISRSGESKESQLIVKSVGQILNPIWSKRNRNIPSETKEDNMNLQGNEIIQGSSITFTQLAAEWLLQSSTVLQNVFSFTDASVIALWKVEQFQYHKLLHARSRPL
ncbi:hypothetical protein KIW84_035376 [Lathyrus oleraceus]|uniref:Uncharacterized protein n=1 Tax=Pisum sativum TaxID=3888 RepID=A0A9D4Y109_PEA|nr:hypothetical protein KIW84_035376 [Pisum sativum]